MCGIIGLLGRESILTPLFQGMTQLQHRGQDAAGTFLYDAVAEETFLYKRSGWVLPLFQEIKCFPNASWGLGHIRYSTSGKGGLEDAQPLTMKQGDHTLALIHNGNLVNYTFLRHRLEEEGIQFQTQCDTEVILHLLVHHLFLEHSFFDSLCTAVTQVYAQVEGAYSIIGMVPGKGMFAFRDPKGIRPLLKGKSESFFGFASETLALSSIGCETIEDLSPGEVIWIDPLHQPHRKQLIEKTHSHHAFEFNYFAKTPTIMEGKEIYEIRSRLGKLLAQKIANNLPFDLDVIVPIPETGNPAGIALSQHLHIPFAEGFIRNTQSGRTFITAGDHKRNEIASQKLFPVRSVFQGKNVLLVDDSIIRGTVSKRTILLARQAGAKRILFASTFPPVRYPCIYGIDFPCKEQLIATKRSLDEIAQEIGADSVIYNEKEALRSAIGLTDLCMACVTGDYPTSIQEMKTLQTLRRQQLSSPICTT